MAHLIFTSLRRHRTVNRLYVLMAAGMIAVLYAVLALIEDDQLLGHTVTMNDATAAAPVLLVVVLVVILLFTIVFLLYMNAILIERRAPTISTYRLLGMPISRIGLGLLLESLLLGTVATLFGILGGWVFSKFLAMMLLRLMNLPRVVGLLWAPRAAGEIGLLFLIVYALLGGINMVYAGTVVMNQAPEPAARPLPRQGSGWRTVLAWCGAALLVACYVAAYNLVHLTYAMSQRFVGSGVWTLLAVPAVGLLALYLVFRVSLPTLLGWLKQRSFSRRSATVLLTLTTLQKRLQRNVHSLFLTTVLATITMTVLGSGAILYQFGQRSVSRGVALDVVVSESGLKTAAHHLKPSWIRQSAVLPTKLAAGRLNAADRNATGDGDETLYNVMSSRDYARIRRVQPSLPKLTVRGDQGVMILFGRALYQHTWLTQKQRWSLTLTRTHQRFRLKQVTAAFPLGDGLYFDRALVVPDRAYRALTAPADPLTGYTLTNAKAARSYADKQNANAPYDYVSGSGAVLAGKRAPQIKKAPANADYSRRAVRFKAPMMAEMNVIFGMGLFIVILLGAVFIIATASILLIKQLMLVGEERQSRRALEALGMPRPALRRIIAEQTGAVFALPLVFGTLNSGLIIRYLSLFLNDPGFLLVILIIVVYVAVYLAFAVLTMRLSNRL